MGIVNATENQRVERPNHSFIWLRKCLAVDPVIRITLFRLRWPEIIVIEDRGRSRRSARNSMQASFARPSTGAAVRAIFKASPNSPTTAFLRARGCTLIANVMLELVSWRAITSYMIFAV